jgi:hypothetical protein
VLPSALSSTDESVSTVKPRLCRVIVPVFAGLLVVTASLRAEEPEPPAPPRPYVLLDLMHQVQRYADKLYFSGQARNWRLADWYLWKLEAAALPMIEGKVQPYGNERYDARVLMKAMLIPAIRGFDAAIAAKDHATFTTRYRNLVNTCNACHVATEHGFVKITVPTSPIYTNQDYSP